MIASKPKSVDIVVICAESQEFHVFIIEIAVNLIYWFYWQILP